VLDWLPIAATLAGSVLLFGGGLVGSILTYRVTRRANETAADTAERSAENVLIDQLQEELGQYRVENNARATEQDRRMQSLEERNLEVTTERDILRDYAHQLRSDIYNQKEPPPTEWPAGVYR